MITPEQHRRLKDLVESALDRPLEERTRFLNDQCFGDAELMGEAKQLLRVYSDEEPPAEPERIGPYRLIQEIGSGGMGIVYLAEREGGFHRRVAMKVIRRGMDTDFFLARFFKEREILGALDHPGVVRIVDAGSTVDGRPYLVMDYVDGIRIDKYCEQNRLSLSDRVRVFLKVCSAVQHAHRNLIVHRDLKPGNILVTPDGDAKLLDFGIAKVVDENDERTQLTIPIMTRQYASPEQVKGKRITTSCDIYALGLILYELLTGHRPYDLKDRPVTEVERIVCELDPPVPSESTVAESANAASGSRSALRGDLDRIIMMALRKEPERRYGSVEAMAADLTRYLDGRPVSAQRDTWHYRSTKFLQRNRTPMAVALVILATLGGGASGMLWQARQARLEREHGEQQRQLAEARLADLSNLIFDVHATLRDLPGAEAARNRIIQNTIQYADKLVQMAREDERLLAEAATAYERVGLLEPGVDNRLAHEAQKKALDIRESLARRSPGNRGLKRDWASSLLKVAETELRAGHKESASAAAARASEIAKSADFPDIIANSTAILHATGQGTGQ